MEALWSTKVVELGTVHVIYRRDEEVTASQTARFSFSPVERLPSSFLRSCGVEIDTKFGEPR